MQETEDRPQKQLSASDLLKSARESHSNINQSWDEALASAKEMIAEWSSLIRKRALRASEELESEITLKWEISSNTNSEQTPLRLIPICSVTIVGLFSKEPLVLWHSGIRGGIYGSLDLSRAIGEPEVREMGVADKCELVKWKEPDNKRIGRVELIGHIDNSAPFDRERGILLPKVPKRAAYASTPCLDRERGIPVPKVLVRATPIRYDDYDQNFKATYHREKSFADPEEAFEVFLAIVVENSKVPQYDVRQQSGEFRRRHGSSHPRITDRGEFEMHLLED